ncbi:maker58 [Drosophila busckii]|uniref:Maker58 n=1 Tax=Drosophila busckii TaxID=30019 RepID=A0A0M4EE13_DROBS|nr:maker58 [Drosophila busckii]
MDFVNIGEDITITRSDGRVQSAKVDEIREDCVTVTWTEDFKVMGKEIVWANVLELNPHLIERAQQGGDSQIQIYERPKCNQDL